MIAEAVGAAVIASALDCIVVIDDGGRIIEFNPAAERTFGYARKAALGRTIGELIVPPALRQHHAEGFARYLAGAPARILGRRVEIEAMRADGGIFPVELTITEVHSAGRRLFTAHLRDLTAARAAEAEIRRQREALHQSEKMAAFGSLLASIAHELNNPLSIVIGNALMLAEEAETAEPALAERARRVQAAAERCARIVRSFLAMARQRKVQPRNMALGDLVRAALELLGYGLRTAGIEVATDLPADLPTLFGDPDQLQQVLMNLLVNASQALEGRPVPRRITIAAHAEADAVVLEIADNGAGVPAAIRDRIFDPFFTTKPVGTGTGIGLGVSRGIVEGHGGTITLAPAEGGGAHFIVRLPIGAAQHEDPTLERAAAPIPVQGGRVLIVDDEPEIAQLLADMLRDQGFRGEVAASGSAALAALERHDYDAILCDVRMPDIDGQALFEWVVRARPHLVTRMAFVTGDSLGAGAGAFLATAGRPFLEKPFMPAELARLMAALITR
jgi:two-component system NtrC family sensor kinase